LRSFLGFLRHLGLLVLVVVASDVALPHCHWWSCAMFVGSRRWLLGMVVSWVVVPGVVDGGWKKDIVDY